MATSIHSIFIAAPAEAVRLAWCERRSLTAAVIPAHGGCVVVVKEGTTHPSLLTRLSPFSSMEIMGELETFKQETEASLLRGES
jgi:hypothetical protein